MKTSPSPFRRPGRAFRRLAVSGRSDSGSSGSLVSLSRWFRETALSFLAPLVVAFAFDSSSDAGWDIELLCFETAAGDGELVRWRFGTCLKLVSSQPAPFDFDGSALFSQNTQWKDQLTHHYRSDSFSLWALELLRSQTWCLPCFPLSHVEVALPHHKPHLDCSWSSDV